jgi:hypothetical protein
MNQPQNALGAQGHQSLRRPLTLTETRLAAALVQFFATGRHDFLAAVEALQQQHIARPSGATEPWTVEALEAELKHINLSLDEAYTRGSSTGALE